ncbi:hypothetical protein EG329_004656 [Mollisiaceae sp. DMI_Dod_QoI]|nr:hypothetical protein EG329_004656 [Helotiales sp. DMI_Dod_QoI]
MHHTRIFFALTLLLTAFFTFLTPTLALSTEPTTGKIICISPNDPHVCQIRLTMYYEKGGNWPPYNPADYPYNGNKYPKGWYDVWVDVYDGFCRHLGLGVGGLLTHMSIDSELPWTVELELPMSYARTENVTGLYAGHGIWPSNNIVTYFDPGTPEPWGQMTSSLYGFPC